MMKKASKFLFFGCLDEVLRASIYLSGSKKRTIFRASVLLLGQINTSAAIHEFILLVTELFSVQNQKWIHLVNLVNC